MILNKITFPKFTGINCNMMPFIQGNSESLPEEYKSYSSIVESLFLNKGRIGYLTIDEKYVDSGTSQRGFNSIGIIRNVHVETGNREENVYRWGSNTGTMPWGHGEGTRLAKGTKVLIANSIDDTCRIWDNQEFRLTHDGDLSEYIEDYSEESGTLLKAGEVKVIDIHTPHECVIQKESGNRQFFRIVDETVYGREPYFTKNSNLSYLY
jgi:hypothetical protein